MGGGASIGQGGRLIMTLYELVCDYTMLDQDTLNAMADIGRSVANLDGALVQCGCWKGGSAAVLRAAMGPRPVWLFDSFQGMSAPDKVDGKRARWKYENTPDWHLASPADVEHVFMRAGVGLDGVVITPGWFRDTLPLAQVGPIAFLHIDVDWRRSTQLALETFYDLVQPGGVVMVDDYGHWPGCRIAVDTFREERGLTGELTMINRAAGYWRVSA